jgi:hypothetical protein
MNEFDAFKFLYRREKNTNTFRLNWPLMFGFVLVIGVLVWALACKVDAKTYIQPPDISVCTDGGIPHDADFNIK